MGTTCRWHLATAFLSPSYRSQCCTLYLLNLLFFVFTALIPDCTSTLHTPCASLLSMYKEESSAYILMFAIGIYKISYVQDKQQRTEDGPLSYPTWQCHIPWARTFDKMFSADSRTDNHWSICAVFNLYSVHLELGEQATVPHFVESLTNIEKQEPRARNTTCLLAQIQ